MQPTQQRALELKLTFIDSREVVVMGIIENFTLPQDMI